MTTLASVTSLAAGGADHDVDDELRLPHVDGGDFVVAIRSAAPYIHMHNGKTFVIAFPGEICLRDDTDRLLADIALLSSLGVRIVLVHGVRPQIEAELQMRGEPSVFAGDLRVTNAATMEAVKAAVGSLRMDIEARLSASLGNTPMAGSRIKVVGGNWVTARPVGVRDGIDHLLTGEVRSVNVAEIRDQPPPIGSCSSPRSGTRRQGRPSTCATPTSPRRWPPVWALTS